jgi:hypothetical protein
MNVCPTIQTMLSRRRSDLAPKHHLQGRDEDVAGLMRQGGKPNRYEEEVLGLDHLVAISSTWT